MIEEDDEEIKLKNKSNKKKEKTEIKKKEEEEINEQINNESTSQYNLNVTNAIIFDGSISPLWYSYLINILDPNNFYTLKDADYLDLSKKKLLYETCNISNVSPSFIVKQKIIAFEKESFNWLNIAYIFVEKNYKTSKK